MKQRTQRIAIIIAALIVITILNRFQGSTGSAAPENPEAAPQTSQQSGASGHSSASSSSSRHSSSSSRSSSGEADHWAHHDTLQDHFERHGPDFEAETPEDYARMAHEFYLDRSKYQIKTTSDGVSRIYDPETNTFGAYNKNGTTRSFYKPSDGQRYFDRQPGN